METTITKRDNLPKAIPINFGESEPDIKLVPKKNYRRRNLIAKTRKCLDSMSADAFMEKDDIDDIIYSLLLESKPSNKRMFTKAGAVLVGMNTGYRAGDVLSLRVKDVLDENGEILDYINLDEDKTNKSRNVYFNKAVKTTIRFLIDVNHLTSENYLFAGEGNRTTYIDHFDKNEKGELVPVTTGERFRPDGTEREISPLWVCSLSRIIRTKAKELGIEGHYSSHCMRKTFAEFISRNWIDERNPMVACEALNHANIKTTVEHYMRVDPRKLKHQWLNLNLGLEVMEMFIEDYYADRKEMTHG